MSRTPTLLVRPFSQPFGFLLIMKLDGIVSTLRDTLPPSVHLTYTPLPLKVEPVRHEDGSGSAPSVPPEEKSHKATPDVIFYVGGESLGLTNLLITNSSSEVRLLLSCDGHYLHV